MNQDDDPVVESVEKWVEKNRHNPSFRLVVGKRSFTSDELLENIKQNTSEGKKIREMILYAAADLILR